MSLQRALKAQATSEADTGNTTKLCCCGLQRYQQEASMVL